MKMPQSAIVSRCFQFALLAGLLLLVLAGGPAVAERGNTPEGAEEYEVKAAFLYNFSRFTEWPDSEKIKNCTTTIHITVLGQDPFEGALEKMARTLKEKDVSIEVRQVEEPADLELEGHRHIVFIAAPLDTLEDMEEGVLQKLSDCHALTVSDEKGFATRGGMIEFFREHGKIRFAINTRAVEKAELKLHSQLLKLARIVDPEERR